MLRSHHFYLTTTHFRLSHMKSGWPAPSEGPALDVRFKLKSCHSYLLCHVTSSTSQCPWRTKKEKQEAFSFTKCRISNSAKTYIQMPEAPSPSLAGRVCVEGEGTASPFVLLTWLGAPHPIHDGKPTTQFSPSSHLDRCI